MIVELLTGTEALSRRIYVALRADSRDVVESLRKAAIPFHFISVMPVGVEGEHNRCLYSFRGSNSLCADISRHIAKFTPRA